MSNSIRLGCLVVLGIIGFMVVAPMFGGGDQAEPPSAVEQGGQPDAAQEESADTGEAGAAVEEDAAAEADGAAAAADMGIEATLNDVHWTIIEAADVTADLGDEISHNGKLVGVRYTIENLTSDPLTSLGMELTDDAGNKYSYLSDALPYIEEPEACETETIEPDASITCTAIYDVADDAADLRAVVTDLNMLGGESEEIALPVN
ncbi:MAG: hypothetical protein R3A44_08380 [Caldilineaceae bacterium]